MVPSKTMAHRSPPIVIICKISSNATSHEGRPQAGNEKESESVRNAEIIVLLT